MRKIKWNLFAFLFFLLITTTFCSGADVSITLENDTFNDTDRHYTHGTRLTYFLDESFLWMDFLSDSGNNRSGLAMAQHMYTPSDITVEELIENDRPYGGWLYIGLFFSSHNKNRLDFVELDIGVTGQDSLSEDIQKFIHEVFDNKEPKGWDNQIDSEFGINLIYQRKYRFRHDGIIDFDFIPQGGGCLGNIFTYANIGATARLGYNIPDNFGFLKTEPTAKFKSFGIYVFGSAEERYVLRNIFLDGNTFSDSHNVEKEDFVTDYSTGLGISYGNFEVIYSENYRSKEFDGQEEDNQFNSLILSWKM